MRKTANPKNDASSVLPLSPASVAGLVSFWDFAEQAGKPRVARGGSPVKLREGAGPVRRTETGVFGPYAAELRRGDFFFIPRGECDALSPEHLTIVAWVLRRRKPETQCEAVAGIWNESLSQRRYGLFIDLRIRGGADGVGGHVSGTGTATPGNEWCMEAAIGAEPVHHGRWHCLAFTYDGREVRAYLDGLFDPNPGVNPFVTPYSRLHGSTADFTVGAVHRLGEMGNWFCGLIAGLAVYDHALTPQEILGLSLPRPVLAARHSTAPRRRKALVS